MIYFFIKLLIGGYCLCKKVNNNCKAHGLVVFLIVPKYNNIIYEGDYYGKNSSTFMV